MWPAVSDVDQWRQTAINPRWDTAILNAFLCQRVVFLLSNTFGLSQLCNAKMHCLKCLLETVFLSRLAPNSTKNNEKEHMF